MKNSKITIALLSALAFAGCGDEQNNYDEMGGSEVVEPTPENIAPARPELGRQIDRVGRAAINTALNMTFSGDADAKGEAKDAYNAAGPEQWGQFTDGFAGSLAILDSLDTVCGNQLLADPAVETNRYATLASILADDQLYVNTDSGECGTYLGLEAEVVGAVPAGAGGCGGRTPSDDVIERSYSVLAAGALGGIDDTITGDDGEQSESFPFLAAPTIN